MSEDSKQMMKDGSKDEPQSSLSANLVRVAAYLSIVLILIGAFGLVYDKHELSGGMYSYLEREMTDRVPSAYKDQFNDKLNSFFEDGKITNGEFSELEDLAVELRKNGYRDALRQSMMTNHAMPNDADSNQIELILNKEGDNS